MLSATKAVQQYLKAFRSATEALSLYFEYTKTCFSTYESWMQHVGGQTHIQSSLGASWRGFFVSTSEHKQFILTHKDTSDKTTNRKQNRHLLVCSALAGFRNSRPRHYQARVTLPVFLLLEFTQGILGKGLEVQEASTNPPLNFLHPPQEVSAPTSSLAKANAEVAMV